MMTQDCAAILVPLTACREPVAPSVSCVTVMTRKMQTEPARAKYVILCCNRHAEAEGIYWRLLVGFSQQASIAQVRQKLQQVRKPGATFCQPWVFETHHHRATPARYGAPACCTGTKQIQSDLRNRFSGKMLAVSQAADLQLKIHRKRF